MRVAMVPEYLVTSFQWLLKVFYFLNQRSHWFYIVFLCCLWYFQYAYIYVSYASTYYAASHDFILLALHLGDLSQWGSNLPEGSTAQFRGIGYPLYLLAVSLGTLDLGLIENANYGVLLVALLATYLLSSHLIGRLTAFVVTGLFSVTFIPFAFVATILSEHVIMVLLMVIAPLSVMSVLRRSQWPRVVFVFFMVLLCMVKTIFAPMLVLFLCFWIIEWGLGGFKVGAKRYFPIIGGTIIGLALSFNASSFLVTNYSSGMFVFGLLNTLVYGAAVEVDDIEEIYDPFFEQGILDDKSAMDVWKVVVRQAKVPETENALLSLSAAEVRKELFRSPTLGTYWQIKWKLLLGSPSEQAANKLAQEVYFQFISNYPAQFVTLTLRSWMSFVQGEPRTFKYTFVEDGGDLTRPSGELFIYGTNLKTTKRLTDIWRTKGIDIPAIDVSRKAPTFVNPSKFVSFGSGGLFISNFVILLIWLFFVLLAMARIKAGGIKFNEAWWRLNGCVFLLQGSFVGLGLATVLLHPPLGRYILPLTPLVAVSLLVSMVAIYSCVLTSQFRNPKVTAPVC